MLSGNMCKELCHNVSIDRFDCKHVSDIGKKVILFSRDIDTMIVLKSDTFKIAEPELGRHYLSDEAMSSGLLAHTMSHLRKISGSVFTNDETFSRFLSHLEVTAPNVIGAMASGQSLLSQGEYVTLNKLQHTDVVPKLYGVCGNFYAVEHLPADSTLLVNSMSAGWPFTSLGENLINSIKQIL